MRGVERLEKESHDQRARHQAHPREQAAWSLWYIQHATTAVEGHFSGVRHCAELSFLDLSPLLPRAAGPGYISEHF